MRFFILTASEYWKSRKRILLSYILLLVFSFAFLMLICFFDRSEKMATMEQELYLLGDYDICVYDSNYEEIEKIRQIDGIEQMGYYDVFGYAGVGEASCPACYFDSTDSIDMYHLTCTRGRYPERENEVAADVTTLRQMRIYPYPGEKIVLDVYDADKNKLVTKEYTLTGVYELLQSDLYGGALRYPVGYEPDEYEMPVFTFYKEDAFQNRASEHVNLFAKVSWNQPGMEAYDRFSGVCTEDDFFLKRLGCDSGRHYAYAYLLGVGNYGEGLEAIRKVIRDGDVHMDYLSGIIIPVIFVLAFCCIMLAVVYLTKLIMEERKRQISILRSFGTPMHRIIKNILLEFCMICLLVYVLGSALGTGLYSLAIHLFQTFLDVKLYPVWKVDFVIDAVTYNPYLTPIVVVFVPVFLALMLNLVLFFRKTPMSLRHNRVEKRARKHSRKHAAGILLQEFGHREYALFIIVTAAMFFCFCGYQFFTNVIRYENSEIYAYSEYEYDYKIENRFLVSNHFLGVEQWDGYGIPASKIEPFFEDDRVSKMEVSCTVFSTKLVYPEETELAKKLAAHDLRPEVVSTYMPDMYSENEEKMIKQILTSVDFKENEAVVYVPTMLLSDEDIVQTSDALVAGQIDMEKIRSGREVILCVEDESYLSYYHVGDMLPFCNLDCVSKETGTYVRYDAPLRIGAIMLMDTEGYPYTERYDVFGRKASLEIVSSLDAMSNLGISEKRYSDVGIRLRDGVNIRKFEDDLYSVFHNCDRSRLISTIEIKQRMRNNEIRIYAIFVLMLVSIVVICMAAIMVILFVQMYIKRRSYEIVLALGCERRYLSRLHVLKNIRYPLICSALVVLLNGGIVLMIREFGKRALAATDYVSPNWYIQMFDMFTGNWPVVLLVVVLGMVCVVAVETIVQFRYRDSQTGIGSRQHRMKRERSHHEG